MNERIWMISPLHALLFAAAAAGCGNQALANPSDSGSDSGNEEAGSMQKSVPGLVVFGGADSNFGFLGDTWTWNGTKWTQESASGPSARAGALATTLDDKVALFGGFNSVDNNPQDLVELSDTWTYSDTSWAQQMITGPGTRAGAAIATLNGTVVLFGGSIGNDPVVELGDTWVYNGMSWTEQPIAGPSARENGVMATVNGTIVLFGGCGANPCTPLNDTWTYDGTRWTEQRVAGPSGRFGSAMATLDGAIVLFGGSGDSNNEDDTWTWSGSSWTQQNVNGPSARYYASMASLNGAVTLFGGFNDAEALSDTWTWNGTAWMELSVSGPGGRFSAAMAAW